MTVRLHWFVFGVYSSMSTSCKVSVSVRFSIDVLWTLKRDDRASVYVYDFFFFDSGYDRQPFNWHYPFILTTYLRVANIRSMLMNFFHSFIFSFKCWYIHFDWTYYVWKKKKTKNNFNMNEKYNFNIKATKKGRHNQFQPMKRFDCVFLVCKYINTAGFRSYYL